MSTQAALINTHVGVSKGVTRIWAEGLHLHNAGIKPGSVLKVRFVESDDSPEVQLFESTNDYDHQVKVSKRTSNGTVKPLLELRHHALEQLFGTNAKVRVVAKDGKVVIRLHHIDARTRERFERASRKLANGESLTVGSIFHGGGSLDAALHEGWKEQGIDTQVTVVNEIDRRFLNASISNNSHLFGPDTLFIDSPIEAIDMSKAPSLDIVVAGVPCTGASLSGRSSKKLKFAESHETAGALFYSFLQFVQQTNPVTVIVENVPQYQNTASYLVICNVLESLGYHIEDAILNGNDFGALEARNRLFMVATTEGLPTFDFGSLVPCRTKEAKASEILDDVALDDPAWRTYPYLDEAEAKAKAKGNGIKRSYITQDCETTKVIKRTNHKCQSDGVFVQHPTNKSLSRQPSAREHAKLKSVPQSLIQGLSHTVATEILGQGIIYCVAKSLAKGFAEQCLKPLQTKQPMAA